MVKIRHCERSEAIHSCFLAWIASSQVLLAMTMVTLRRRQLLRREAAVEGLALGRHLFQEFRRGGARAVFGLQLVAKIDGLLRAHEVDIGKRSAGELRKT